jgi:hypothetical protein
MHAIAALLVAAALQDEAAKRIADRIDKILQEHSARVQTDVSELVRKEMARAGVGSAGAAAAWEKLLADRASKLGADGVSGQLKKACADRASRRKLAELLARAIPGDPAKVGEALFEEDESGAVRVRPRQEEKVKKALAELDGGATPTPAARKPRLGFSADPAFSDDDRKALGLAAGKGVRVSEVPPDGPADKAGLKVGDVVVKIDGKDFPADKDEARRLIGGLTPGKTVELELLRGDAKQTLQVTVGEQP